MDSPINGQAEAMRLLRKLREMNSDRERPRKSADMVAEELRAMATWPHREQQRFARVVSDFLVGGAVGWGFDLDEYADMLTYGKEAMRAQRERAHQEHLAELAGKPVSVTH